MQDSASFWPGSDLPAGSTGRVLPLRFDGVAYIAGATEVLAGIDLAIGTRGPTVVMGPNGSGKTTLLRLAIGLISPTRGSIRYGGAARPPRGSLAIVFQKPVMLRRSAAANIAFALKAAGKPAAATDVRRLLEMAGIAPLAERPARRLSGGEQQRLALARALAREPGVLMLDEPTASLDPSSTKLVEDLITQIAASGVKVIMTTHHLGQARRLAEDVAFLAKGRLVEHSPAERFFKQPVSEEARRFLAGDLVT